MRLCPAQIVALGVLMAPGLVAQQESLPHAFPREGATQVFANAWMDAWEVTFPVDAPTPMHRHRFDYFGVELVTSRLRLTAPDGDSREVSLQEGQLWFLEQGTTHIETGLTGDPERHAIVVDLRGVVPARVENRSGLPHGPATGPGEPDLDNERVTMWHVTWLPDRPAPLRFLTRPVAVLFMEDSTIEWTNSRGPGRTRSYKTGQVELLPAGEVVGVRAVDGPAHVVLVEIKR